MCICIPFKGFYRVPHSLITYSKGQPVGGVRNWMLPSPTRNGRGPLLFTGGGVEGNPQIPKLQVIQRNPPPHKPEPESYALIIPGRANRPKSEAPNRSQTPNPVLNP